MTLILSKRDDRQSAYIQRARKARRIAWLLVPLACFGVMIGLWSDPDVRPQLLEGIEEIQPLAAGYVANTPFENIFGAMFET